MTFPTLPTPLKNGNPMATFSTKKGATENHVTPYFITSGWQDLNLRPPDPESSTQSLKPYKNNKLHQSILPDGNPMATLAIFLCRFKHTVKKTNITMDSL